jgi:hypothetical protein
LNETALFSKEKSKSKLFPTQGQPNEKLDTMKQTLAVNDMQDKKNNLLPSPEAKITPTPFFNKLDEDIETELPDISKGSEGKMPLTENNTTYMLNDFQMKELTQTSGDELPEIEKRFVFANEEIIDQITDTAKNTITEKMPVNFNSIGLLSLVNSSLTILHASNDTAGLTSPNNCSAHEGFFYEVGVAWLYGWKGAVHRDARCFSPIAGINYMNRLGNNSAFSFGLQYLQVRNLSNSSKTSRVSSYIYGEQSNVTVIKPITLHYLLAPLRLQYKINCKHSFGLGINLAYLLNVDASVTKYEERPGSTGNYKTSKQNGYTEGFSWFDSQLALCYRRKISHSFGLQSEFFLGLTDVKQDDFFGFKNKEKNSGMKLSLIYYPSFKKEKR